MLEVPEADRGEMWTVAGKLLKMLVELPLFIIGNHTLLRARICLHVDAHARTYARTHMVQGRAATACASST